MNKLSCVIVEDDSVSSILLRDLLSNYDQIEVISSFEDALSAFKFLKEHPVDLIFLDVEMPKMSGIELARVLPEQTKVVIMTSNKGYAVDAFEVRAYDFILKPIGFQRLEKIIGHLGTRQITPANTNKPIFIRTKGEYVRILREDLLLIKSEGVYVKYITATNSYLARQSFKEAMDSLGSNQFVRVHRSFIVNIEKIEKIDGDSIRLHQLLIPIGKSYKENFFMSIQKID